MLGLGILSKVDQRAQKEEGWTGRGREYTPAEGMGSASPEWAKSQFQLLKAQFKVVPGWELACSWLKRGRMRGRVWSSESDTSSG